MAQFLSGKLELIELNDTTWRNKLNANFTLLTAAQELDASSSAVAYTIDSSPPTNSTYDHMIFGKLGSTHDCTVTLPTPTMGRTLFFMISAGGGTGALQISPNPSGTINGSGTGISVGTAVGVGAWCVATDSAWFLMLDAT